MWSRRRFLAALGASSASASLASYLGACGQPTVRPGSAGPRMGPDEGLARVLARIDPYLDSAFVWSRQSRRYHLSIDSSEQRFDREQRHWVIVGGMVRGAGLGLALLNPDAEQLLQRATELVEGLSRLPGRTALSLPALTRHDSGIETAARHDDPEPFRDPVAALFAAAHDHGGSRIVFRSASLHSSDCETVLMSRAHNQRSRQVRTRAGVLMAAWTGADVATARAEVAGLGGPAIARIGEASLDEAARSASSHVHSRSAPSGTQDLLLSPDASALLAYRTIALPSTGSGHATGPALPAASSALQVVDDPSLAAGYGSYSRDDEGAPASPQTLLDGEGSTALAEGRRRRDAHGVLRSMPSNILVSGASATLEELIADVKSGVLIEGPEHASLDRRGERLSLLCSRGREIRNGQFTGRLFGRIALAANRAEFLAQTRAVGADRQSHAFDEDGIAVSVVAPHWLSRGQAEAG